MEIIIIKILSIALITFIVSFLFFRPVKNKDESIIELTAKIRTDHIVLGLVLIFLLLFINFYLKKSESNGLISSLMVVISILSVFKMVKVTDE